MRLGIDVLMTNIRLIVASAFKCWQELVTKYNLIILLNAIPYIHYVMNGNKTEYVRQTYTQHKIKSWFLRDKLVHFHKLRNKCIITTFTTILNLQIFTKTTLHIIGHHHSIKINTASGKSLLWFYEKWPKVS